METPDPPDDTPGGLKTGVVLTSYDMYTNDSLGALGTFSATLWCLEHVVQKILPYDDDSYGDEILWFKRNIRIRNYPLKNKFPPTYLMSQQQ